MMILAATLTNTAPPARNNHFFCIQKVYHDASKNWYNKYMFNRKVNYLLLLFIGVAFLQFKTTSFAAKPRVKSSGTSVKTSSAKAYSSARLSRPTNSVSVTFLNPDKANGVSYTLSYDANGISQGVIGSVSPGSPTDSRDLYFGTCSHGVCTPHYNITNASLVVTTSLKSGVISTKRYRIKM